MSRILRLLLLLLLINILFFSARKFSALHFQ